MVGAGQPGGPQEGTPSGTQSVSEGGTAAAAETTAETDPAAAARQQEYQTEITASLRAGEYQRALALFKEYGNPNLRALNEVQTLMHFEDYFQSAGLDETDKLKQFEDSYWKAGDEPYSSDRIEKDIADLLETDISQVCLGNIPQESKQVIYNGVERCIRKFPKIKEQLRSIVYDPNIKSVAKSHSINGIIFVGKNFSDLKKLKKMYDYNVQHNFYPKGTNVNSIIIHEIGHQFEGLFSLNGIAGGGIGEFGIIRRSSTNIQKEILSRLGLTDEKLKAIHQEYASKGYSGQELDRIVLLRKREFITQHVSEYASNNEREFFAELFSEYMTSDSPRKAAQVFGDIFEREYGGLD